MIYNESNLKLALESAACFPINERRMYIKVLDEAIKFVNINTSMGHLNINRGLCNILGQMVQEVIDSTDINNDEENEVQEETYDHLYEIQEEYENNLIYLLRALITQYDFDNWAQVFSSNYYIDENSYSPLFTGSCRLSERYINGEFILNPEWYTERVKILHAMKAVFSLDELTCRQYLDSVIPNVRYI